MGVPLLVNGASAQERPRSLALKNGESTELFTVYSVAKCRSILVGEPDVEVLEGPPEVSVSYKEAMVVPRNAPNCTDKVKGGIVTATASNVNEQKVGKMTIRVKYTTKDGPRQSANVYNVSLFPQ